MSEKNKLGKRPGATRKNGPEQRAKAGTRNAIGQFLKGSQGGPGRGHRRERGDLATRPTPAGRPSGAGIACGGCGDLGSRLELAERGLELAGAELAVERAASARQSRWWSAALHALEAFPQARTAVLDAVLGPEEAEQAAPVSGPAAGASLARPGGEPAVPADPGVPLPAGKRGEPTVYDGARRVPVPPNFGGVIETGRPERRGVDGIGDRYGDSGPLDSRD